MKKSWLRRTLAVKVSGEDFWHEHYIQYKGRGIKEKIYVNDVLVSSAIYPLWFVPRFKFFISGQEALLEVRVSPWLTIQSLRLFINGSLEYSEGNKPIRVDNLYAGISCLTFLGIIILLGVLLAVGLLTLFKLILLVVIR